MTWEEECCRRAAGTVKVIAYEKAMATLRLCPHDVESWNWPGRWMWIMIANPRAEHMGLLS